MRRADWTPVVLITATISVSVVAGVLLTSPWLMRAFRDSPGPPQARRSLAPEVAVWVGDLGGGVKVVLAPVWGEDGPDRAHDARLNEELSLPADGALAWYQMLVFNTTEVEQRLQLGDDALSILGAPGAPPSRLRSLAGLVARGEATPTPALRRVLEAHGAFRDEVVLPAGLMADLLVGFSTRVALQDATEVASADGVAFRRRPIPRRDLDALVARPDAADLEDL